MLRGIALVALTLLCIGCSDASSDAPRAPASRAASPPAEPGVIAIPQDSAQLRQIRVAAVEVADVPQDEVVAVSYTHLTLPTIYSV